MRIAMSMLVAALGSALLCTSASAQQVTYTKDVLPILQEKCISCHRENGHNIAGMVAPMSFTSYREVRPWAKAIVKAITTKQMPPWGATPEYNGHFLNERVLTAEQANIIERWVEAGAPRGNPEDAPAPMGFPDHDGWNIGIPDLVVYLPEPYYVDDEVSDLNTSFVTEISEDLLPENKWLRSIEWRAGSDVVHHIVGGSVSPGEITLPDGTNFQSLGSIAPGEDPTIYPEGYGKILHKGSSIRFGMHYHKEPGPGTGTWDYSMIGFRFWDPEKDPPVKHQVHWNGISARGYEIPPGHAEWPVGTSRTFKNDTTILSLHPHMHLRGRDMKYVAFFPDGTQETILDVPTYDYDWQINYTYAEPRRVPAGTRIEVQGHYNNSTSNVRNPDPTAPIHGGETSDKHEMFIGFISYCDTNEFSAEESAAILAETHGSD